MRSNNVYSCLLTRTSLGVGLGGLRSLLARLGNPQKKFKIIHVAGTNGKGSVCTLLAHTLTCSGQKTGLFVSPHLVSPTERISINGKNIPSSAFLRVVKKVLRAEAKPLNFFEILTAAAFVYFAEKKVQYAVLETGLGGRKDPTNVCVPILSIITSIGLDHTHLLGNTLEEIAAEKAGIIKPHTPIFCGEMPAEALRVITRVAQTKEAPLMRIYRGRPFVLKRIIWEKNTMILTAGKEAWPLHLLGEKQPQNANVVYHVCRFLKLPTSAIRTAFQTVRLRGRFEVIPLGKRIFIFDGAHNPQAIKNLILFYKKSPFYKKATLLCGFMKDKDHQKMLKLLVPHFTQVIVTVPPGNRAAHKKDISSFLSGHCVLFEKNLTTALERIGTAPIAMCTGSFYLVGSAYKKLVC